MGCHVEAATGVPTVGISKNPPLDALRALCDHLDPLLEVSAVTGASSGCSG